MPEVSVTTVHNNFARGQVDHDLDGRFDLPIYQSGARAVENFITNFKGNTIYRPGYERMLDFQDGALAEFKFGPNQNYILALYASTMQFAAYAAGNVFGWVLNGGGTNLQVTTPYTLAQSKDICSRKAYTQNFDSMIFTINGFEPMMLKRTAANAFTFNTYSRFNDPFPTTWAATKAISGITKATQAVFTITAHGYSVGSRFLIAAVAGMTDMNGYTAAVQTVVDANHVAVDIDSTAFGTYTSGGTSALVTAGDYPNVCLFYKSRLWYAASTLKPTTLWASAAGDYFDHSIPTTVLDESALQLTPSELDARIEWLEPGSNSLILATVNKVGAINGGSPGDAITANAVQFTLTDCDGTSTAAPLSKDALIFYVTNDKRRLDYFSYDLLTETFGASDANVTAYDITLGGILKQRWVKNREDLIFATRGDGSLLSCNFNKSEKIIGWHVHPSKAFVQDIANIADTLGVQQLFLLNKYNGNFYIERQAPYIEFKQRKDFRVGLNALTDESNQLARDAAKGIDDVAYYRYIAEQLKQAIYLDNANLLQDLRSTTLTFTVDGVDPTIGVVTASGASFTNPGSVGRQIAYKTATGYEVGRFLVTGYNSATSVNVQILQQPLITSFVGDTVVNTALNVWSSWYMSFNSVPSMARFNSTSVKVVADGGFLDDFTVSGGAIPLGEEVTSVVVGYGYTGVVESFPLGFQLQANNTQDTQKIISRVGLRCHDTSGGRFGTTQYRLDPVQKLTQDDLNYLPPQPINETVMVDYTDDSAIDKGFLLVQDIPLPMTITASLIECNYGSP